MADFKLKYIIDGDNRGLKNAIRESDDAISSLSATAGRGLAALGGPAGIATAAAAGIAAIGTAAISTGAALFNLTRQAADFGSEIFDASKKTGLTAEALSSMKFAADQSGSSMESVTASVAKFAKTVGAANEDTKKGEKFLRDFGLTPQEAINDLDGALAKVFKRIQDAPAGIERITLAQKAFGKSGADLLPFIDSFEGDLASLIRRAKELGVTIDEEAARAADEFGDQLDTLSAQFASAGRAIGTAFMPFFLEMAEETSDWATKNKDNIKDWGNSWAAAFQSAVEWIRFATTELMEFRAVQQAVGIVKFVGEIAGMPFQGAATRAAEIRRQREAQAANPYELDPLTNTIVPKGQRNKPPKTGGDGGASGGGGARVRTATGDNRTPQQVYQAVVAAFKAQGVGIGKDQGFRTREDQVRLFRKYGLGGAARPGTSGHEFYKAVDLPAGISQAILNAVSRQAGVTFDKPLFHGKGSNYHRHQPFKKGKGEMGGGEEDADQYVRDQVELEEKVAAGLKQISEEIIRDEQETSERRLDIRRAEAELKISIIEDEIERGLVSERTGVEAIGQIKFDLLKQEQDELRKMVQTEERRHQIQMLDIALTRQAVENEQNRNKILRDRLKVYASLAIEGRSGDEQVDDVLSAKAAAKGGAYSAASVTGGGLGGSLADIFGADLVPMIDEATGALIGFQERMAMVGADMQDFVGGALAGMVDGLAQMAIAWIVTGEGSAKAALQMMAATALSIAVQAGIKAVFEAAEAAAAYARYDFYAAAMHTAAAQMYINTAVIAGAAGIGLALGARAMGGGGGGGSRGQQQENVDPNFGGRYGGSQNPDPFSRTTGNPYQSGRNSEIGTLARAVEGLEQKIGSMRPGDVLTAGIGQKRGFVTDTVTKEVKTAGKANGLQRALGMR